MMMVMMMVIRVGRIWRSDTVSAEATDWKLKAAHPSPNAIILRGGQDDHHEGDQDDHHEEDRDDHHEKDQEDHHEEYQDNHHEDDQDDHHEDDQDDHHKVNLQGVPKKSYLQNAAGCCWSKEERGRWPFSEEGREDHLKWNNIVGKILVNISWSPDSSSYRRNHKRQHHCHQQYIFNPHLPPLHTITVPYISGYGLDHTSIIWTIIIFIPQSLLSSSPAPS